MVCLLSASRVRKQIGPTERKKVDSSLLVASVVRAYTGVVAAVGQCLCDRSPPY